MRTYRARTSGYSVSTTWTASDVLPLQACSIHLQSHPLHSAGTISSVDRAPDQCTSNMGTVDVRQRQCARSQVGCRCCPWECWGWACAQYQLGYLTYIDRTSGCIASPRVPYSGCLHLGAPFDELQELVIALWPAHLDAVIAPEPPCIRSRLEFGYCVDWASSGAFDNRGGRSTAGAYRMNLWPHKVSHSMVRLQQGCWPYSARRWPTGGIVQLRTERVAG